MWGGGLILDGRLTVGTLLAFVQLSSGFLGSVFGFVQTYLTLVVLRPQLAITRQVLARPTEKRGGRRPVSVARSAVVEMDDVWFRYAPEAPWIVRGYSMRFEAGQQARGDRPLRVREEHHPALAGRAVRSGGGHPSTSGG